VDPEALERRLDLSEHSWHRISRLLGEPGDVGTVIAVLGRLLAAPHGLDGVPEAVHLGAGVVVVVLPLDGVARKGEQAGDAVAVRPVPRGGDGDRAGRVCGHHLYLHPLRGLG
jgi:hypothetical protein